MGTNHSGRPHSRQRGRATRLLPLLGVVTTLALLVGLLPAFAPTARAAAAYTVVDLGLLTGGTTAYGYGINNSGQIAGYGTVTGGATHAFRWQPNGDFTGGTLTDLGTLGGTNAYGAGLNDNGHVIGHSDTATGKDHAFAYPLPAPMLDLGTLGGPSGIYSGAQAMNNNGDPVGYSKEAATNNVVATTFDGVNVVALPSLNGDTHGTAYAINDAGLIAGYSGVADVSGLVTRPVKWTNGAVSALSLPQGKSRGEARGINKLGMIVGIVAAGSSDAQAVRWSSGGALQSLGSLGGGNSYAYGINDGGQVVGRADIGGGVSHAFVWDQVTGMVDLNTLIPSGIWELTGARGINNKGQIVAIGTVSGKSHAYLLNPANGHRTGPAPGLLDQVQAQADNTNTVANGTQLPAQIFTAGRTGLLDQVTVLVTYSPSAGDPAFDNPAGPGDLIVQIRAVGQDGLPTETVLGTNTMLASSFTPDVLTFRDVPLLTSVPVTKGTKYALVLAGTQEGGSYKWYEAPNNPYAAGREAVRLSGIWQFAASPNYDFTFRTYVTGNGGDADGDGLQDEWEENGVTFDPDGNGPLAPQFIDLPAMGANKNKPDIFLQIDWMQDSTHNQKLGSAAFKIVVDAFKNSPYTSPTGSVGINLHIDEGSDSILNFDTNTTWGALSRARSIPWQALLGTFNGNAYNWTQFQTIKDRTDGFTQTGRAPFFHYVIAANEYKGAPTSSGLSRGIGASDLIVTLGSSGTPGGTTNQQAGTLMHELGHNLGLRHGGGDDNNYKPNYISIMTYANQFVGIIKNDTTVFDYSRVNLGTLNEASLNEANGLGSGATGYGTRPWCASKGQYVVVMKANNPIDWNCNGTTNQAGIAYDTNNDGTNTTLTGYNDWANLVLVGGSIGQAGATPTLPTTTVSDEITWAEAALVQPLYNLSITSTTGGHAAPDAGPGYPGGENATITAVADSGYTFSGWTIDGAAGGTANPLTLAMTADRVVVANFTGGATTHSLTVSKAGSGSVTPGSGPYPANTPLVLTATADDGNLFTGWSVNGTLTKWTPTLTLPLDADATVVATFAPRPAFTDVAANDPAAEAIAQMAARGIINGCFTDPVTKAKDFCPTDNTLRHQMAALIARAMPGWVDETGLPSFGDNTDDTELMTRVATLQRHLVVRGYQAEVCAERGIATPPGCYGPLDTVKYGQVMLFIARAMVNHNYWTLQDDDRTIFPDQNGAANADPATDQQTLDHRMVVTYIHYAGAPPDVSDAHAPFALANGQTWGDPTPRTWFARAFWQALDSYFGH